MPYPHLTAIHLVLLARGALRRDGAILPAHRHILDADDFTEAVADDLVHHALAQWVHVAHSSVAWAVIEQSPIGLVVTDLGRAALDDIEKRIASFDQPTSKIGRIIQMLESREGVSLLEIIFTTGWKPHSARAALSTLRKRGFAIRRDRPLGGHRPRYHLMMEAMS